MQKLSIFTLMFLAIFATGFSQNKKTNAQLDKFIEEGMTDWKIPGLSVAVVKSGEVIYEKAFGVKDINTGEKVNTETLFAMASTTKAFIAISMGMLVDEGKLSWNDKVIDHYPEFRLADSYITRDARISDLLTHNLGMGNADFLWTLDSMNTPATLQKFAKLNPSYPLRGGYTYQNIMYAVAGEVIGKVSGKHWSDFVQERIFNPLGMTRSTPTSVKIHQFGNHVTPHAGDYITEPGKIQTVDFNYSDQIGAAGMMWSCIDDISKYLQFLTNDGILNGDTLLQPNTFKKLFTPQIIIPEPSFYPTTKITNPSWTTYGLGWFQQDYRGKKLDFHTGSLHGLIALAGVMHDKDLAFYFFGNLDHAEFRHAVMFKVMDLYGFNDNSTDWNEKVINLYKPSDDLRKKSAQKRDSSHVEGTSTLVPLSDFTGTYQSVKLGSINIQLNKNTLNLNINEFKTFTSEHWHYDSFRIKSGYIDTLFYFKKDENNKIAELVIFGETFQKQE